MTLRHTDITARFAKYDKNVYTPEANPSVDLINSYFPRFQGKNTNIIDLSPLERPLNIEELYSALKKLPIGKAHGPDGFTVEFNIHFSKIPFLKLF